jgi:hypothetical protein
MPAWYVQVLVTLSDGSTSVASADAKALSLLSNIGVACSCLGCAVVLMAFAGIWSRLKQHQKLLACLAVALVAMQLVFAFGAAPPSPTDNDGSVRASCRATAGALHFLLLLVFFLLLCQGVELYGNFVTVSWAREEGCSWSGVVQVWASFASPWTAVCCAGAPKGLS